MLVVYHMCPLIPHWWRHVNCRKQTRVCTDLITDEGSVCERSRLQNILLHFLDPMTRHICWSQYVMRTKLAVILHASKRGTCIMYVLKNSLLSTARNNVQQLSRTFSNHHKRRLVVAVSPQCGCQGYQMQNKAALRSPTHCERSERRRKSNMRNMSIRETFKI